MSVEQKRPEQGSPRDTVYRPRVRLLGGSLHRQVAAANDNRLPLPLVLRRVWAGAAAIVTVGALIAIALA